MYLNYLALDDNKKVTKYLVESEIISTFAAEKS
jgi:hypothetical protein